jgi:hypothetical protein
LESQLEKFNSKQEVIELVKQMEIEINQKLRDISRKNNQNKSPSKPNFPPPLLILVVGGGFLGLVLIACLA